MRRVIKTDGSLLIVAEPSNTDVFDKPTGLDLRSGGDERHWVVTITDAYTGLIHRKAETNIGLLNIVNCVGDSLNIRGGGFTVEQLVVIDTDPYIYSDQLHKDVVQAYSHNGRCLTDNKPVDRVTIRKVNAIITGDDKHFMSLTERCEYRNFELFTAGIDLDMANNVEYFLSACSLQDAVIGSPEHPIDPARVSNKAIRIGGIKDGSPDCSNITIHALPGLKLILSEQAASETTLIEHVGP